MRCSISRIAPGFPSPSSDGSDPGAVSVFEASGVTDPTRDTLSPMRQVNGHVAVAAGAAAVFHTLAWADQFWSGGLAPSPFWLATSSVAVIALAVPARFRPAAIIGQVVGLITAGLIVFDESARGLVTPTVGNVVETIIIVWGAVRLLGEPARIRRTSDAVAVLGLVVVACLIGGGIATSDDASVRVGERAESWWRWTLGDVVGATHLLPLVLFAGSPLWFRRARHGTTELAVSALAIVSMGAIAFATDSSISYLLVPAALWMAIRFGPVVATAAAFSSALAATIASGRDIGPFVEFGSDPVVEVQAFNVAVAVSAIIGGAHALRAYDDQERVRASEQRWRRLVDSAFDGIGRVGDDGLLVETNPAFRRILGLPAADLVGRPVVDVVKDTDWDRLHRHIARFAAGEASQFETWALGHDGTVRWLRVSTRPRPDGGGLFVVADLTWEHDERQRRRAAEHRLETVERDQRDQLARDLHDGPVQDLSAAIVRLATARRLHGDHPDLAIAQDIVEQSVDHLRGTLRSLADGNVSVDGLAAALDAALHRLSPSDAPSITIDIDPDLGLDDTVNRTVFDVVREAAANAVIHADATNLTIRVQRGDDVVHVTVADDGSGFDTSADVGDDHLGLRLMRTRSAAVRGTLEVDSTLGRGTVVTLTAPRVVGQPSSTLS